jgi:hypothetical protein
MILSAQERKDLYRALATIEEVVMDNVDMYGQKLPNYNIWIDEMGKDDIRITVDNVPKFMTILQALYLAERLIEAALNADKIVKLKRWIEK